MLKAKWFHRPKSGLWVLAVPYGDNYRSTHNILYKFILARIVRSSRYTENLFNIYSSESNASSRDIAYTGVSTVGLPELKRAVESYARLYGWDFCLYNRKKHD